MRVVEVLTQGACCGLKVQIRKNVLDVCVYVCVCACVWRGGEGVVRAIRSVYEKNLKRERYFVSASHSGLSSRPLS